MSELGRFPVRVEMPVMWGDMDALGHVNNAVYARWAEQARIAYFERIGLLGSDRVGPILARQVIDFRHPVVYPDGIAVDVTIGQIGNTSLTLRYRMTSREQARTVVEAESVIVVYDYVSGAKVAVSDELRQRIFELERG